MAILAFLDGLSGSMQQPVDVEADAIIRAYFKRHPDSAYHVTKLAMTLSVPQAPAVAPASPGKSRGWFSALLERRDNFAS